MTVQISPHQLQFFRNTELEPSAKQSAYYVLGEFDYFRVIPNSSTKSTPDGNSHPSSAVIVNWITHPQHKEKANWAYWIESVPEAYLCRVDFGPPDGKFPIISNKDDIKNYWTNFPFSRETNFVANQLSFIDRIYKSSIGHFVTCFQSIGAYSVYVLVEARHAFEEILPVFWGCADNDRYQIAATTSMALVQLKENSEKAISSTSPRKAKLLINAPLPIQPIVVQVIDELKRNNLSNESLLTYTLGDFDFLLDLREPLRTLAVISKTINDIPGVVATTTIETNEPTKLGRQIISTEVKYLRQLNQLDEDISAVSLEKLSLEQKASYLRWKPKLVWVIRQIQAGLENPATQVHLMDVASVFIEEIINQISQWLLKSSPAQYTSLDTTLDILLSIVIQRKQPRLLPPLDYPLSSTTLNQGSNLAITAVSRYLQYLFQHARHVLPEELSDRISPYSSIVFDYEDGFMVYPHHLFSIPFDSAFTPCAKNKTWQTLSHEVCHAIAVDTNIQQINSVISAEINMARFLGKGIDNSRVKQIQNTIKADFNEILAHWLDANIFYFRDSERYFRGIWATWKSRTDRDNTKRLETAYILRSFVIYLSLQIDFDKTATMFTSEYQKATVWEDYEGLAKTTFERSFDRFARELPRATDSINMETIENYRSRAILFAANQIPMLQAIVNTFPDFNKIQPQSLTNNDTSAIKKLMNREIYLERIDSPLLLLQELHQESASSEENSIDDTIQFCALLAMANSGFSDSRRA